VVERRLRHADPSGGDADASQSERREGLAQALPLHPADEGVLIELDVVVVHVGGQLTAVSHLEVGRADPDPGQGRVDDEQRQPLPRPREGDDEVRHG
jgi:hypothetical protein